MSNDWPGPPPQWGYGYPPPPPGYGYPPGPAGYPPGYPAPGQPGVIPLRPLSLGDIFNGAIGYVRANPKPTLGLTAAIVVTVNVIGFLSSLAFNGDRAATAGLVLSGSATLMANTLLSGMLTVIVARAVLGARITTAEAWRRVRGRMPALIALTLLEFAGLVAVVAIVVGVIAGVGRAAGGAPAALVGVPLVLALLCGLVYLYAALALAPVAIVLERKGVIPAVRRAIALCHKNFWRILGTLLLAGIIAKVVSTVIAIPFDIARHVLNAGTAAGSSTVLGTAFALIALVIGGIVTTPFVAGVVTLLYVDARMRSEPFFATALQRPWDLDGVWLHP